MLLSGRQLGRALRAGVAVAALGLAAVAPAGAKKAGGAVLYATPSTAGGDCSVQTPCSLATAIAGAQAGDTVMLNPGVYHVSSPLASAAGITVQGDPTKARPRLVGDAALGTVVLTLTGGATVRHLAISSDASAAGALSLEGLGEDLLLLSGGGTPAQLAGAPAGTVLRDTVAYATGAGNAVVLGDSASPGPVDLRNVTAIARGATAGAVVSRLQGGQATIKNVVARGGGADLDATGSNLAVSNSNFRPAFSPGVTDAGANQSADPRFVDPAHGDFHPLPGSPLSDAGAVDPLVGAVDPDGNARTLGAAPNIGAYEATAAPLSTATAPGSGGTANGAGGTLPPAAAPRAGKRLNVKRAAGTVLVKLPGTTAFVPVKAAAGVPVGAIVDARRGAVLLASARDVKGTAQTGVFSGGEFKVRQSRATHMVTVLALRGGSFAGCPTARAAGRAVAAVAKRRRTAVVRQLWGHDHGGRFRTDGRYASGLVRGTVWLTQDRCDGTLVRVKRGAVSVHDFARHRSVVVRAGHHYLVRRR